jgi:hypothetical protein
MAGACTRCDDPGMIEYGNGISHGGAGQVVGSGSHPIAHPVAQNTDLFSSVGRFANDASAALSTLSPIELVGLVVLAFVGLIVLRRVLF